MPVHESSRSLSRGQLLALAVLSVVLGLLVVFAIRILFALFAGVLLALILRGAAQWVSRITRLPYVVAVVTLVLLGIGGAVLTSLLLLPKLGEQIEGFGRDLPKVVDSLRGRVQQVPLIGKAVSSGGGGHFDPSALGKHVLGALGGTVELVSGLVVAFFVGVYGAAQPELYSRAALAITPKRHERHVERALHETAHNLERWLWGRIVAMVFVGVTTSIVFHVLHIPLALTLGLFAGLLTFIEYAGAVISAVPPVLLGFSQSTTAGTSVLVAYVVVHVIEGYVLTPLLARASVHLPPALTLATQALLGSLTGVLGLTFSTPLFVVAVSAVKAFRRDEVTATSREAKTTTVTAAHHAPARTAAGT